MNNIVVSNVTQANHSNLCCLMVRGVAYARRHLVIKLWVSYEERHPKTLIDNELNHLRHQLLTLGDAYARGQKANVVSAGGSEANRGRREVATFATARFN